MRWAHHAAAADKAAPAQSAGCRTTPLQAGRQFRVGSRSRGRAGRGPAAGLRRLRRVGRAGDPGPARIRSVSDRGHARDRAPLPGGTRRSVGAGRRQHRPGALRQQPHPRAADRAGPRLGRRERPAGHPVLPARGAARPGPNDLRRHPEPPRVADRIPRRGHAGRGTPLVPAACCRPFMTERSPAGSRLHLLAAPVLARPQEPRAALVQQLTHPAPHGSMDCIAGFKRPV